MILAVDIGNTNVVLGCMEDDKIHFLERMATDRRATDMEYLVRIRSVLKYRDIDPAKLEGAIICSGSVVVTQLTLNAPNRQNATYAAQLTGYGNFNVAA